MSTVGNYLLQMSCWLAAFWLVYVLLLKKETYFALNRWFLNAGLVVSVVMPLVPFSYKVYHTAQPLTATLLQTTQVTAVEEPLFAVNYWLLAYLVGTMFFVGRLVTQHVQLYRIRKRSASISIGALKVYRIEKETAPFSFFNHIYISSKMSNETEFETVVAHEKVHIHERHWADLLLLEVVRTLQWFNPLLQLYRKAIMQNHEYLADSGTIEFGVSARTYHAVLANQMLGVPVVRFANSFTFFNSSNRILMMKKDKSTPIKRLKLMLILPLMAIIVMGFAKPDYVTESSANVVSAEKTMKIKGKVTDKDGEPLPGASVVIAKTTYGTITDINGEFILDAVKPSDNIVVSFVGYETFVSPAKKEMTFKMERNVVSIEVRKEEMAPPPPPPPPFKIESINGKKPLIVLDGEISSQDVNEIDPNSIQLINVLKDQAAIDKYGKKGKDGVIEISTKKQNEEVRTSPNGETFVIVEDMPQYPGGEGALQQYIQSKVAGSKESGTVYVRFIVAHDGSIKNAKIAKSTNEKLNAKALEIVNNMQKWEPGKQRGKPVKVDYTVKIEF